MILIEEFKNKLIRQSNYSDNTIEAYIRTVKDFEKFIASATGSEFNPGEIIELDVKEYKSYLLNIKKQAPNTINQKLSGISSYFNFCMAKSIVKNNPAAAIKKVAVQNKKTAPEVLEQNEFYRLKREVYKGNNKMHILIFELLYNTGVRVSELCNIELDDMRISERKGLLKIRSGKGEKYREIPLNSDARKAIIEYLEIRPYTDSKRLIIGERGPMGRTGIFKIIKKYSKSSGVEAHPHTLRHQFCHDLLVHESISTVAEFAGHSDINTTYRYTIATKKEKYAAIEHLINSSFN
ncbi:phage integrase family protein [Proteiniborus sp. DW1]|uniref:tyrosine-type recombinase/integrase n=1 Tax=Proteiniborus sp. DW1 TaxID=1889883 RepID=UPI00092DF514|nr:tyrosine-type recombinase/integrase [Proteiniborus sp. DW1]SCG83983.1 phage integrase family protein [Proteiniborus sp. DW1]